MVYGRYNYSIHGVYKPTYNWGAYGYWSKPWHLVNPKIAGKWMFIPLKMVLIGIEWY
jgi:hypothetical protein